MNTKGFSVGPETRPRPPSSRLLGAAQILCALALLACAGCANPLEGVHAYNSGRDKTAQTARTTYTNLNLLQVVFTANTNPETFHSQELLLWDKLNANLRDLKVFAICTDNTKPLDQSLFGVEITDRLCVLFGGAPAEAKKLADGKASTAVELKTRLDELYSAANKFEADYKVRPDPFSYSKSLPDARSESFLKVRDTLVHDTDTNKLANFDAAYKDYTNHYAKVHAIATGNLGTGELSNALANLAKAITDISQLKKTAKDAAERIKTASDEIATNLAAGKDLRTADFLKTLTNGLVQLRKAVDAAAASGNSFAIVFA